jgi:hypothetical protein
MEDKAEYAIKTRDKVECKRILVAELDDLRAEDVDRNQNVKERATIQFGVRIGWQPDSNTAFHYPVSAIATAI